MTELADVFRRHGPAYRQKYEARMLPSHLKAMQAIEQCRTDALGGQAYYCEHCEKFQYSYHSCRNRHCPKCQWEAGEQWLKRQQKMLLPVPYFLLTFTLPSELRRVARSHQKSLYSILFRASAVATQELTKDPRFVGGKIGMIGVLHTWTRDLNYHPHVHYLVPGGGLSDDLQTWMPSGEDFLVHVRPLSVLFRATFRDMLRETAIFEQMPADVWKQDYVVHCKLVGSGITALKYLAPYIFRVAISNHRILKMENNRVTFRYKDRETGKNQYCNLDAEEFIRRFLQHVLPKGFVKVRYYGFFSSGNRPRLRRIRQLLGADPNWQSEDRATELAEDAHQCPNCGNVMIFRKRLPPVRNRSP
ncbi:MAG: IS91 family transposase [Gallionellaceae bacterium]